MQLDNCILLGYISVIKILKDKFLVDYILEIT